MTAAILAAPRPRAWLAPLGAVFGGAGALVQIAQPAELGPTVSRLLQDPSERERLGARAKELIVRNRGALRTTVDALAELVA